MTRLIFVRHGQSKANVDRVFAGHFNTELTELGHKQAELTAEYIYNNYKVDAVYASDLKRAFLTGKHVADRLGLDVTPDCRLREIYAGKWEGNKFDDNRVNYPDDFYLWDNDIGNCKCTDGESARELGARIFGAVSDIASKNDGRTVVIATHAIPIRCMQVIASGGDYNNMKNIPWTSNSSVSVANYENGVLSFELIGYDGHLGAIFTTPELCK